jgi:hypothetical protein
MMVGSNTPLAPDHARMRHSLEDLNIDSKPAFDHSTSAHRIDEILAQLALPEVSEDCDSIRLRSQGLSIITDDNMGEEW